MRICIKALVDPKIRKRAVQRVTLSHYIITIPKLTAHDRIRVLLP